jgi:hypothetical protein
MATSSKCQRIEGDFLKFVVEALWGETMAHGGFCHSCGCIK